MSDDREYRLKIDVFSIPFTANGSACRIHGRAGAASGVNRSVFISRALNQAAQSWFLRSNAKPFPRLAIGSFR